MPQVVVAQSAVAAALWDAGYRVKGAYGELTETNGKLNYQAGNLDLTQLTVIGRTYGEFDLERYAALGPELLIDMCFIPPALWYVPETIAAKVEAVAPTLGMPMPGKSLTQAIELFTALAAQLGADPQAPALAAAKTRFETELGTIRSALLSKRDLKLVGLSPAADTVYVANPGQFPEFTTLTELGATFLPYRGKESEYFEQISWENVADYDDADVIFIDGRSADQQDDWPALWRSLSAVKAGQAHAWQTAAPYSYAALTPGLQAFAKQLSAARPLI